VQAKRIPEMLLAAISAQVLQGLCHLHRHHMASPFLINTVHIWQEQLSEAPDATYLLLLLHLLLLLLRLLLYCFRFNADETDYHQASQLWVAGPSRYQASKHSPKLPWTIEDC
jgi:hypothetical protein